jgi:superfamily II DNA or RNA helicase
MSYELYDWQETHARKLAFALKDYGSAMDASDMGTGKTIIACKVARSLGLIPVVICPKAVVPNWKNVINDIYEYGDDSCSAIVYNYEHLTRSKKPSPIIERSGRKFRWRLNRKHVILIFDEVHKCKGDKSLNGKLLYFAKEQGYKTLLLSATACHDPTEMKSIGYALGLHGYRDYWQWCLKNGCRRGIFGGLDYHGSPKVLQRLHHSIFNNRGGRIKISDLPEGSFPDNHVMTQSVDVPDCAEFDECFWRMARELDEDYDVIDAENECILTIILRARQQAELMKVDSMLELAEEAYSEGNSVVFFVNFRETLDGLYEGCHSFATIGDIGFIRGGQSDEDRESNIQDFQSNKKRIMLSMISAGGVGISLHDQTGDAPRVSIISPGFSAVELRQALGRIHRSGGKSPARQYIVFAGGTIEDSVRNAVRNKLNKLDLLNDGDMSDSIFNFYAKENTKHYESLSVSSAVQKAGSLSATVTSNA